MLDFIIGGVALMSIVSPATAHAQSLATSTIELVEVVNPMSTTSVRAQIVKEFGEHSVMVRVARCESRFRQFDKLGNVLHGGIDPDDTGVFQVNKRYHLAESKRLGMDIETLAGNIAYARYLFDKNGTRDWLASKYCWGA